MCVGLLITYSFNHSPFFLLSISVNIMSLAQYHAQNVFFCFFWRVTLMLRPKNQPLSFGQFKIIVFRIFIWAQQCPSINFPIGIFKKNYH